MNQSIAASSLADVRDLLQAELLGAIEGQDLIDRCTELAGALQAVPEVSELVPHLVWHYLADADIRTKDRQYATSQLGALSEEALVRRRQGDGPAPIDPRGADEIPGPPKNKNPRGYLGFLNHFGAGKEI